MSEFKKARETMAKAFKEDDGLMLAYKANIAMLLHDQFNRANFKDHVTRNVAAEKIIELVFFSGSEKTAEEEPKATPRYMARYMAPRCEK